MTRIKPEVDFRIKYNPSDIDIKKKIALVENANRTAKAVSSSIKQVSVIYRDSVQNTCIATSDGTIAEEEQASRLPRFGVV